MRDIKGHRKIAYGDFQTPAGLALQLTRWLKKRRVNPRNIVEPTCGIGAFVMAALETFPEANIRAFEINNNYLEDLSGKLKQHRLSSKVVLSAKDFFKCDWVAELETVSDDLLVIGNFPWVTNAVLGSLGSTNLPEKSNFKKANGLDAITGKANFDISEWMTLEVLKWFASRSGYISLLCKTAVARKILSAAEKSSLNVNESFIIKIDAKKEFGASVDACALVVGLNLPGKPRNHDFLVFNDFDTEEFTSVGHRHGLSVADLGTFNIYSYLLGQSPQKWRSGVKHDASAVMELTQTQEGLINGLNEIVSIEDKYLFPLLKGSDVANSKNRNQRYVLVTQTKVGEETEKIALEAPRTWEYLVSHSEKLDSRGSVIYKNNPRFSIFGVGEYAFKPYKVAICSLYKSLKFKLVGPIGGKPVIFDDTVYFVGFDTRDEAQSVLEKLQSDIGISFLTSLIFWDEKRPVKTAVLNSFDWTKLVPTEC